MMNFVPMIAQSSNEVQKVKQILKNNLHKSNQKFSKNNLETTVAKNSKETKYGEIDEEEKK